MRDIVKIKQEEKTMIKFRVYASIEILGCIEVSAKTEADAIRKVQNELDEDELEFLSDCNVTQRECLVQGVR